jgi:hypothetical protein
MADRPEWLKPGTKVAVLSTSAFSEHVTYASIDRVLTRDVVLDSGDRFNADIRSKRSGTQWAGRTDYLLLPDDPKVLAAQERIRFRDRRSRLLGVIELARREVRDAQNDEALQRAADDLHCALDTVWEDSDG